MSDPAFASLSLIHPDWTPHLARRISAFKDELVRRQGGLDEANPDLEDVFRGPIEQEMPRITCADFDGDGRPELLIFMNVWFSRPTQAGGTELWRLPRTGNKKPELVCGWYGRNAGCQSVSWPGSSGLVVWAGDRARVLDFPGGSPRLVYAFDGNRGYTMQGGWSTSTWLERSALGLSIRTRSGQEDEHEDEKEYSTRELIWMPKTNRFASLESGHTPEEMLQDQERYSWNPEERDRACDALPHPAVTPARPSTPSR